MISHLPHSFRVYFHIFPTRFECDFSAQVFTAVLRLLDCDRVTDNFSHFLNFSIPQSPSLIFCVSSKTGNFMIFKALNESERDNWLLTIAKQVKKYTRNEWRRCIIRLETRIEGPENTLETSGKDDTTFRLLW